MATASEPSRPSVGRRIGRAALIVAAGVFLSRALGLVRDIVFAAVLGADQFTDEYQVAFLIPDFLNYLLAGGYMAITFIPILSRYLADGDEQGGWEAFGAIARPVGAGMVVLVAIAWVAAEPLISLIEPGFTESEVARATRLTRIVLPAQVFFVVGSLFMAVQYARERFLVPTLAPIIYNLGIIAGGVLLNLGDDKTPDGFAWGVLAGAIVGNFAVQAWGASRVGWKMTRGRIDLTHRDFRDYLVLAVPLMLGQSLVVLDEQLGRSLGSLLEEPGAISWLQFARRTMLVPVGVIAQAAGVAAYPYLARLFSEGRHRELAATMSKALRYVAVFSVAAAGLIVALSIPIVEVLYERGRWTSIDTVETAGALLFFGLGIPLWGIQQLLARGFYARREMWIPVVTGTAATVGAIPLYLVLLNAFEVRGLAAASTLALAGYTAALAIIWYRRTGSEWLRPVVRSAGRATPLAAIGAVAAWGTGELVRNALDGFTGALVAAVAGAIVFLAAAATTAAGIDRFRSRAARGEVA